MTTRLKVLVGVLVSLVGFILIAGLLLIITEDDPQPKQDAGERYTLAAGESGYLGTWQLRGVRDLGIVERYQMRQAGDVVTVEEKWLATGNVTTVEYRRQGDLLIPADPNPDMRGTLRLDGDGGITRFLHGTMEVNDHLERVDWSQRD
jgi:hypothetical protein